MLRQYLDVINWKKFQMEVLVNDIETVEQLGEYQKLLEERELIVDMLELLESKKKTIKLE